VTLISMAGTLIFWGANRDPDRMSALPDRRLALAALGVSPPWSLH